MERRMKRGDFTNAENHAMTKNEPATENKRFFIVVAEPAAHSKTLLMTNHNERHI